MKNIKKNLRTHLNQELINESNIDLVRNDLIKLNDDTIEGRFLSKQDAEELQREIESNYSTSAYDLFQKDDIRKNIFNFDHPVAEKEVNGVTLKIVQGLIRNKRKTYLLYANNDIIGEFYSVDDIKRIIKFIESKLIKNLSSNGNS